MGNTDTKLTFRKAIVQLNTKNQVIIIKTFFSFPVSFQHLLLYLCAERINIDFFMIYVHIYNLSHKCDDYFCFYYVYNIWF